MKNFGEVINSEELVLVDFYADWCGPCKIMAPELEKLATEMAGIAKVIKVNVEKNQAAASAYRIQGIPTLILFQNGEILWRQAGATDANSLRKIIEKYVKNEKH